MNKKIPEYPDSILQLTNGRIADVHTGCYYDEGTSIFIKEGRIISISPGSAPESGISADITYDLKGKAVLPGLFNSHCHIQMINPTILLNCKTRRARKEYHAMQVDKNMEECLARGITNIRDAYTDDLRPNRELASRIGSGQLPGPRIQQAIVLGQLGGYLSPDLRGLNKGIFRILGQGKLDYDDENSGIVVFPPGAGESEIRDLVDMAIGERGADLIKVAESLEKSVINSNPGLMEPRQMAAIAGQAAKRGLQSTIHSVSLATFRRAVSAGFSSIAHVPRDGKLFPKDIEDCLRAGCIVDPTLSVGYDMSWRMKGDPFYNDPLIEKLSGYRSEVYSGLADEFWIPGLAEYVKAGFKKAFDEKYNMFGIVDLSKLLAHFSGLPAYGFENAKMLFESGVSLSCGNDGGIQSCTPAMIGHELALMDLAINMEGRDITFDPAEAIRSVTINSARSMGIDDKFGSIEAGKIADLAILDGDPLKDISLVGEPVAALFMDGRLVVDKIIMSR